MNTNTPIHQYTFFIISRSILFRMKNVPNKSCRVNQNTHFVFTNFFLFRKSCCLWDNVGKHCIAGQATDENRVHALCILDTEGYKHTLKIRSTYCFFSATVVTRTRLNVNFISTEHCLCFSFYNRIICVLDCTVKKFGRPWGNKGPCSARFWHWRFKWIRNHLMDRKIDH
jgi:hypothetical protein